MSNNTDNGINTTEKDDTRLLYTLGEALGEIPSDDETRQAWEAFEAKHNRLSRKRRAIRVAIAALATAAVVASAILLFPWNRLTGNQYGMGSFVAANLPEGVVRTSGNRTTAISTPTATTLAVDLPDGTHVLLGPGSRIEYSTDFNAEEERAVKLDGMAHFDVRHDAERPFVVEADGVRTEVLGTVFDVKAYHNVKPTVTLYSGRVRVSGGDRGKTVTLKPGQTATLDGQRKVNVAQADLTASAGWLNGMFIFDDERLEDVMNDIGSWYNVTIAFADRKAATTRVHFSLPRSASLPDVLRALNDMGIGTFTLTDNKVTVK